jgi:hypothetical protein
MELPAASPESFQFDTPGAKAAADADTPDLTPEGAQQPARAAIPLRPATDFALSCDTCFHTAAPAASSRGCHHRV